MRGVNRCYKDFESLVLQIAETLLIFLYFFFSGIVLPLAFEKRTLVPPSCPDPTRDLLPSASTSMTFETWMVDSCSAMTHFMLHCGFGLSCFLPIMTPSTRTRALSAVTRSN